MALLAKGIVGGEMAWPLVVAGIFFGFALILINAPAPMLIAVGMYLPFHTTFSIFVGGCIKALLEFILRRKKENAKQAAEQNGLLLASGFVAGESLTAVLLAVFVFLQINFTKSPIFDRAVEVANRPDAGWYQSFLANWGWIMPWLGLLIFGMLVYVLIKIPRDKALAADKENPEAQTSY